MDDCGEHPDATQDHYFSDIATAELADLYALANFFLVDGHEFVHHPLIVNSSEPASSEIDAATLGPHQWMDDLEIVKEHMHMPGENNSKAKKGKTNNGIARVSFRTKSEQDVMEDGYKWRKYGKKSVKNNTNPRNYYKCMSEGCTVKKRVERDRDDSSYVITTYEGIHDHGSNPPPAGEARAEYEERSHF